MSAPRLAALLLAALHLPAAAAAPGYAVVVAEEVLARPGWKAVCEALREKHPGSVQVTWKERPEEALERLSERHPAFTCFVAPCTATGPDFVASVHRLTRRYDADPYTDTRWGIVTGYDAAAALELVRFDRPIEVRRTSSGTAIAMDMVEEAVWYDELVANKKVAKIGGATEATEERCPTDTTRLLAATLSDWNADLFVTSGHGFERGWQIGFRYRNGFFESEDGKLYGKEISGERFAIHSGHPRVYLPIGNCLVGCIRDKHAYALAMMKEAGVKGMVGYTVPTWYGYAGWGCLDTFLEQPGRYTLNEAFLANQLALVHRLSTAFPALMKEQPEPGRTHRGRAEPSDDGRALGVTPAEGAGLLHDRDVLAYYGDPALDARMAPRRCAYEQSLEREGEVFTLRITGNRGERSFAPVHTNGSQRGGRPIVQFLPCRLGKLEILEGGEHAPVVADDFVLVPNPGEGGPDRMVIRFRGTEIAAGSQP